MPGINAERTSGSEAKGVQSVPDAVQISPAGPLGIIRRWDLRGEGGGQGLPPPISEKRCFLRVSGHPGRCFRRVPPEPPGRNKTCSGPPGTEWLREYLENGDKDEILVYYFIGRLAIVWQLSKYRNWVTLGTAGVGHKEKMAPIHFARATRVSSPWGNTSLPGVPLVQ